MCSPFTSAYARTGSEAGGPCAQANSAANGMIRAVVVTEPRYQRPGIAGRRSAQRLVDQRGNAGDVLLQAIRQPEPLGDEGALVVADPGAPPRVLPHEHPQRKLEADQWPRDHQRGPGARVAEDDQLLLLHHEPDAARPPAMVHTNEDGEPFAARGLFDPPDRLRDGMRAQPARDTLRRWFCRHAQSSCEHASERVADRFPIKACGMGCHKLEGGSPAQLVVFSGPALASEARGDPATAGGDEGVPVSDDLASAPGHRRGACVAAIERPSGGQSTLVDLMAPDVSPLKTSLRSSRSCRPEWPR